MDDGRGRERLAVLGRPLPGSFKRRLVVVAPGCHRAFDDAEWRDALAAEADEFRVDWPSQQ